MNDRQYVYVYRDSAQRAVYVGCGERLARAEAHIQGSHNPGLSALIASGRFSVEAAGPYGDEAVAKAVEAALISVLEVRATPRLCNQAPGEGPRFAPLGLPVEFADRLTLPSMSVEDLGELVGNMLGGGVLLVRLASGGSFKNDEMRQKFDPAHPDDATIFENTIRWWWLDPLVAHWEATPDEVPAVVAGLAGPPNRRYIAGAVEIDRTGKWDHATYPDYQVPAKSQDVDACQLRGRLLTGARFNLVKPGHFLWVDRTGAVRYRPPRSHDGAGPAPAQSITVHGSELDTGGHMKLHSKTWDGRVLNSKAAVLDFLEEVETARREGRDLDS